MTLESVVDAGLRIAFHVRAGRIGVVPALFLLGSGCTGAGSSPEGTVRSFLEALEARDEAAFEMVLTERTRGLVEELESLTLEAEDRSGQPGITIEDWCAAFCGGVVERSTLHGDSATVDVRMGANEDDVASIPLVRTEEGWRIELAGRLEPAIQMLKLAVGEGEAIPAPEDITE